MAKNIRRAGISIELMIEFAQLSQLRGLQDIDEVQKQLLLDQLGELDNELPEMNKVRDLLVYKIDTYDDYLAKFKAGKMTDENIEKLWKEKNKFLLAVE